MTVSNSKIFNHNRNINNKIKVDNIYNKNIIDKKSNYKKNIIPYDKNHKFCFSNTNFSNNNSKLNNEDNNLIYSTISNDNGKEYYFNDYTNPNKFLKNKKINKNILVKRKTNYTPLYEREKEKEQFNYKRCYDKKKDDYISPILDTFDSFNKNNILYKKMSLTDKDKEINFGQKKIIKNNNINNNLNISQNEIKRKNNKIFLRNYLNRLNIFKYNK